MEAATKPIVTTTSLSFLLHAVAIAGVLLVYEQVATVEEGVGHGVEVQLISSVRVSDQQEAEMPRKQEAALEAPSESKMHAAEKKFAEELLTSVNNTHTVVAEEPVEDIHMTEQQYDVNKDMLRVEETGGLAFAAQSTNASQKQHTILELLHRRISDNKEYPYLARRQRREGVATVAFVLHPDGRIENAHLVTSSRAVSLDRAALSAVKHIEPFVAAHEYLEKSEQFQVDIEFDLL